MTNRSTQHLRRQARQLYNVDYVPLRINQSNQRAWVRSILILGDKWLLSKPVDRPQSTPN